MSAPWHHAPELLLVPAALVFNLVLTFWGALAVSLLAARAAPTLTWQKFVLLLPVIKVAYDVARGIPDHNYALSPFAGTRWELGRFLIGYGWTAPQGPAITLRLAARNDATWHSLSGGDLLAHALFYRGASLVLVALVALALLVATVRLRRRVAAWRSFHRELGAASGGPGLSVRGARVRRSAIAAAGAFTMGIWRPTIWLPRRSDGYRSDELKAALRHELAHVARRDVAVFAAIGLMTDLLWFVPGMGFLARRVHATAERAADASAVKQGADPLALARALVKAADSRLAAPGAACAAGDSGVMDRVAALLASTPRRSTWQTAARGVLAVALSWIALQSSFFGIR